MVFEALVDKMIIFRWIETPKFGREKKYLKRIIIDDVWRLISSNNREMYDVGVSGLWKRSMAIFFQSSISFTPLKGSTWHITTGSKTYPYPCYQYLFEWGVFFSFLLHHHYFDNTVLKFCRGRKNPLSLTNSLF